MEKYDDSYEERGMIMLISGPIVEPKLISKNMR